MRLDTQPLNQDMVAKSEDEEKTKIWARAFEGRAPKGKPPGDDGFGQVNRIEASSGLWICGNGC